MVVRLFSYDFTDTSGGQAEMNKLSWYQDQIL